MATSAQVQQLYIALLGRAADKPGLDWWLENINGGEGVPGERTLEQAAAAFTTSEEFLSTYGSLQGAELVTAVYKNLFERTPSQDEVNYWVNDGRPADELLQAFLTYASPADQAVIDNKVTVAQAYTEAAGSEIDLDAAAAIIADVDGTVESVDAALAQIGEELGVGVPGDTFTLTEALAAETLPEAYSLSDATADLGALAIADVAAAQAAAAAVVAGAANAAELELATTYTIADTLANVLAADAAVLADAGSYSLTDATADLGALAIADVAAAQAAAAAVVAGAANAAELELATTYTIADTLANVLAADAAVLADAGSYSLTDAAGALGELTEAQVAVVLGAANAAGFTYTAAFTLTAGLEALDSANTDLTDFFASIDLVGDAQTGGPDGEADFVDAQGVVNATAARAAVEQHEVGAVATYEGETGINYDTDSAVLQAAKLQDARDADAIALANAEAAVVVAQAAVNAIEGLQAKIDNAAALADAAIAAEKAAQDAATAQVGAFADAVAAESKYEINADVTLTITPVTNGSYAADGTKVALVAVGSDVLIKTSSTTGLLVLQDNVTESTNPGITAVLNALKAYNTAVVASDDADAASVSAQAAAEEAVLANVLAAAQDKVDVLIDAHYAAANNHSGVADNIYGEMLVVQNEMEGNIATAISDASATTYADVLADAKAAINALTFNTSDATVITALETALSGLVSSDDITAISAAFAGEDPDLADPTTGDFFVASNLTAAKAAAITALAENNLQVTLDAFNAALDAFVVAEAEFEAADALATAEQSVVSAQNAITALDEAITELAAAEAMTAELAALDAAIKAAETALTDEGYVLPVVLADDANHAVAGTANADIFMISGLNDASADVTINGFAGNDTIFIGSDYTYNAGVYADDGDNGVLEVFVTEVSGEAVVVFETSVFGSNATVQEDFQIILTGVPAANVTIADGFITIA